MTDETDLQNTPTPRKVDPPEPEKPKRRMKAPLINFNAVEERDRMLLQSIATSGARVAGRQQNVRKGQLKAIKDTLSDILADADDVDPRFLEHFFKVMLANATPGEREEDRLAPSLSVEPG
ncbi:MAG: hypothetical protein FJX25_15510 [Alphaproteobacteria bacterium]|nr:hypothetical protein [Alphaproteobacteria bacterium]